ncbi:MAG: permease [Nanobdellota archaeon]
MQNIKSAFNRAFKSLVNVLPIMLGVIFLIGLLKILVPQDFYNSIFGFNLVLDTLIGSVVGSIMAGNPITSYVIGGEFLQQGISLWAVTAFLVSWVTVGLVQLPAEAMVLGKKFSILRNGICLVFSFIVSIIIVYIVGWVS